MADYIDIPRPLEYDQPLDGGISEFFGEREVTGFLPGTNIRVWYTHLYEEFSDHWQNSMEIIVGEKGFYDIKCEQKAYEVRADEILIIPPGTIHSLIPRENCNGFVYLVDDSILKTIKSCLPVFPVMANPIYITEETNYNLHLAASTLLRQMRNVYFSDNSMREIFFYSHFIGLIGEIGRHYSLQSQNAHHFRADKRKEYVDTFNEVLDYINRNYHQPLTLEGTAKLFSFSKFHFSRLFKQYTESTFSEYLRLQRIKAAESSLSKPELSITQIAFDCGFVSFSTFSRLFKQHKSCTPTEYRNMYMPKR